MIERKYVIPLRKEFSKVQRYRRAYKAVKAAREFLIHHMKVKDVRLGKELNEFILKNGRKNPPSRVEVKVVKVEEKGEEPYARANLIGAPLEVKEEKKKKSIGEKLKEKVTAKPSVEEEGRSDAEKEKINVLDHAKLDQKSDIAPGGKVLKEKRNPKTGKIIGETGKK